MNEEVVFTIDIAQAEKDGYEYYFRYVDDPSRILTDISREYIPSSIVEVVRHKKEKLEADSKELEAVK